MPSNNVRTIVCMLHACEMDSEKQLTENSNSSFTDVVVFVGVNFAFVCSNMTAGKSDPCVRRYGKIRVDVMAVNDESLVSLL